MEPTITQALKKGEIVIVVIYDDMLDPHRLGETENKSYIYQIMSGVTPFISHGMPITKQIAYAENVNKGIHFINSQFFLYALNNRIIKYLAIKNSPDKECSGMPNIRPLNPDKVSVFEWRKGVLCPIQDGLGIIRDNCLDRAMKNVMADYHNILNHYVPR